MLTALLTGNQQIEASRDLPSGEFTCSACNSQVILKRGKVKVPHFAHYPDSGCAAAGEGAAHLYAKRFLADQFRQLGYTVAIEEVHGGGDRRVDLAVTIPGAHRPYRVAVEVQDSPIAVEEMKRRMVRDRDCGFFGTAWLFVGRRARLFYNHDIYAELRIPKEMLWLDRRFRCGIYFFAAEQVFHVTLKDVRRQGGSSEWYETGGILCGVDYPDRKLRSTKMIALAPVTFKLGCFRGRYHKPESPDWHIGFRNIGRQP